MSHLVPLTHDTSKRVHRFMECSPDPAAALNSYARLQTMLTQKIETIKREQRKPKVKYFENQFEHDRLKSGYCMGPLTRDEIRAQCRKISGVSKME